MFINYFGGGKIKAYLTRKQCAGHALQLSCEARLEYLHAT